MKVKCLSVRQPWASLLFTGKNVENRTWYTFHRGLLLIHAGLRFDTDAPCSALLKKTLPRGVILGVVNLDDVVTDSRSPWAAAAQYHWLLSNPCRFKVPIPYCGRLGLFEVDIPERALEKARKALSEQK